MDAVDRRLVRREDGLIQIFDPPFDKSTMNPGYIKGYVPGVRENGGQYTHAAVWLIMAFAKLGDHCRTWELLSMINRPATARPPSRSRPTASNPTSWRPTSTRCTLTLAEGAGRGTPARPAGCTA